MCVCVYMYILYIYTYIYIFIDQSVYSVMIHSVMISAVV